MRAVPDDGEIRVSGCGLRMSTPKNASRRVHILGAGPVGLMLAAMLQSQPGFSIRLYEKRPSYTRKRMVKLANYLVADTIEAYREDEIDGENVDALFEPWELQQGLSFRQSMTPRLRALLEGWTRGFTPLNEIEKSLSALIETPGASPVERVQVALTPESAVEMLSPNDVMVDCSGRNSLLRDALALWTRAEDEASGYETNTLNIRLEYAAVVTFLYGQPYECNEYCKYYKNIENTQYKFIPAVGRTVGQAGVTHVTGIVKISEADFAVMPPQCDGDYLRTNFPGVAAAMDRFIDKVRQETNGEIIGELEVIRIPLNLYRARNATNREWRQLPAESHPFVSSSAFLVGDSAIGSPYFQSISLGFECAMFLAGLLCDTTMGVDDALERYELLLYKQWLRVYMRSKLIKHNKDLFESLDDTFGLLDKLHIY
jgi:threonine dehydrogenase-like Zn-dependent dehydrogenase